MLPYLPETRFEKRLNGTRAWSPRLSPRSLAGATLPPQDPNRGERTQTTPVSASSAPGGGGGDPAFRTTEPTTLRLSPQPQPQPEPQRRAAAQPPLRQPPRGLGTVPAQPKVPPTPFPQKKPQRRLCMSECMV